MTIPHDGGGAALVIAGGLPGAITTSVARGALVVLVAIAALGTLLVLVHLAWAAWVRRRFPPPGEHVADGDRALRVVRCGAGPPVLLVHGMNGCAHDFPDALLADLARDHTVLALDRPGHAGSTRGRGALDLAANAQATLAALAAGPAGRAVLVGHSYGAAVVLRAALAAPERVAGVVLVTPCTVADARHLAQAKLPLPPGPARRLALWLGTLPVGLLVARRTRREAWHPAPPPAGLTFSRAWALVPSQLEAALENFHTLPADLAALSVDLPRLASPLVVLAGEDDLITPWRAHAAWLPAAVPGARLEVLEGCGHWLMRKQPGAVAAAVRALSGRAASPDR